MCVTWNIGKGHGTNLKNYLDSSPCQSMYDAQFTQSVINEEGIVRTLRNWATFVKVEHQYIILTNGKESVSNPYKCACDVEQSFQLVIATGTNQQSKKKRTILFIEGNILHTQYNTYYVYLTTKGGMFRTLSTFHWDIKLLKAPCDRPYVHLSVFCSDHLQVYHWLQN